MKAIYSFTLVFLVIVTFSCDKEEFEYYNLATPVVLSAKEMRNAVSIMPPKRIEQSGKIYSYGHYIFVNDKNKGVHVVDNSNPNSPQKVAYIKIPGNVDISVKNNQLFANSFVDLLIFDISDITQIELDNRMEDVFPYHFGQMIPENVDVVDWQSINSNTEFVVDWVVTKEMRRIDEPELIYMAQMDLMTMNASEMGAVGTGGSMARFKIVDNYLYAVDSHSIHIFDIEDLNVPLKLESVFAGFDIETIFNRGDRLFLGSMSGMFIYDISSPDTPRFVSEFQHGTACDPVVVDEEYAYITLRAGNSCGAFDSSLQIVDISIIERPVLTASYPMDGPYGLGLKEDMLFICDGSSGLKIYDKSNIKSLKLINHFKEIEAFDVIPLENQLIMIGDGVLSQYEYSEDAIQLLSSFDLN